MTGLLDVSTLAGPLPVVLTVAGLAGAVGLTVRRGRPWWVAVAPAAAVGAVVTAGAVALVVNVVWRPFPDPLPADVLAWVGLALFAVVAAVGAWWPARASEWWRRSAAVPMALAVVLLAGMKINSVYGYYPTVGDALGVEPANEVDFAAIAPASAPAEPPPAPEEPAAPSRPLIETWRPPPDMPRGGRVSKVSIPGTRSGFAARQGSVYLPPAYLGAHRPALPVLVLIAGQPGAPQDWLTAGKVSELMDRFAAAHAGLAPIVVMPDATGSALGNPLCLDSALGNVETYLAHDVPAWVHANLTVDADPRHWAIGGFSYGGTCALQLAVRAPGAYPLFIDISGQDEPTLGGREQTVKATFGGDENRFRTVNPLDILATATFEHSAGVVVIGERDTVYGPQAQRVLAAATRAKMNVQLLRVPGAHSWTVAHDGLRLAMPWAAGQLGLVAPR
ncbi:alpha/beta hydrolase [Pseudonocardia acaciae]|uniref:alpha/beta hydrolase n=1 Tax=Pseudonocardia acaciae TaxID=551276 RepID=UPI00048D9C76|nr:alpha/beta hydrolase-fold protein [Pseudonocardia acaciae]